jgi:2-polyprenyl-3-methyl-5-hydroxy-6-metoxy-1,4-benzoquinol methylase
MAYRTSNAKEYYGQSRSELLGMLPSSYTRVLEVGCADGSFAKQLKSECELWGVEPIAQVADNARSIFDHLLVGSFDEVEHDLPDEYFDLVICNDVIEHLPDHDAFLKSISKKIALNGTIIGSVPNVRYYFVLKDLLLHKEWRYVEAGVLDRTHLRFFTQRSLLRSLTEAGFIGITIQGINKVRYLRSLRKIPDYLLMFIIEVFSFGFHRDIRFRQFAFRSARKGVA